MKIGTGRQKKQEVSTPQVGVRLVHLGSCKEAFAVEGQQEEREGMSELVRAESCKTW